jgi:hypothetical protein
MNHYSSGNLQGKSKYSTPQLASSDQASRKIITSWSFKRATHFAIRSVESSCPLTLKQSPYVYCQVVLQISGTQAIR